MHESQRALVAVSAALAARDEAGLERALNDAVQLAGAVEVEEALLQSYLFLGYPAALHGLGVWRRVSGLAAAHAPAADQAVWAERGVETCARVYGGQYGRLRANIAALHPDMEQWMVTEGYGKVLGRPGLDLVTRELCVVALLAAQAAGPQLYSHLRGALNAGADEALVDEVVVMLKPGLPEGHGAVLERQWTAVRERRAAGTGE